MGYLHKHRFLRGYGVADYDKTSKYSAPVKMKEEDSRISIIASGYEMHNFLVSGL
jgi:hypothetical protein